MDDTRERLLEAASQVFADKGYEKATVREICTAAKVSNLAAVNYYFGDKERLYIESVKRAHRLRIAQIPLPVWEPDTTPEEKLRGLILVIAKRFVTETSQPWHEQLMMREVMHPTAAVAELVQEFFRPHLEILLAVIDEIIPRGTPDDRRQMLAFSIIGQCLHYRVARPIMNLLLGEKRFAALTPERIAEHVADFSLAALRNWTPTDVRSKRSAPLTPALSHGEREKK
jgi:TetR/AcrR family transcriptional regulator, regulator of cefoperazone and chloramphenicol sensitivity